jgi:hypothetical protein
MRLMLKKRFKDDESGHLNDNQTEDFKVRGGVDDTDMRILDSDYSSSTFHLASRSSIHGTATKGVGQMRKASGTVYGSKMSTNTSGMQTYTTGFFESH